MGVMRINVIGNRVVYECYENTCDWNRICALVLSALFNSVVVI